MDMIEKLLKEKVSTNMFRKGSQIDFSTVFLVLKEYQLIGTTYVLTYISLVVRTSDQVRHKLTSTAEEAS